MYNILLCIHVEQVMLNKNLFGYYTEINNVKNLKAHKKTKSFFLSFFFLNL